VESSVTQHDRHSQRLIIDLITHREKIFKELKRTSIKKARPESLDESQRRVRYEARSRAVSAAAKSPRIAPADHLTNGGDKTPTHGRRVSGITGILARPPSLPLEPPETISLDVPYGGAGEEVVKVEGTSVTPEVTVTDEQGTTRDDEGPTQKLSLGRAGRISGVRALQRQGKRVSLPHGSEFAGTGDQERDDARPVGVTLMDNPVQD